MPTSKDILASAEKTLKADGVNKMALTDVVKIGTSDVAEFAKARSILITSMNSMKSSLKIVEGNLKKLNAGLTALKKNEAVMKAPADSKKYQKILKSYTEMIKLGMQFHKQIQDLMKKGQQLRK